MRGIEVFEPYPNEILYSWLSRMFSWYGYRNNPKSNIREFNIILFGVNSRSINNILIPQNLQELIDNIGLNNSEYFNTADTLIQQTTIIPFYLAFLNETVKKKVIKDLIHNGPMNITKSILGLKDLHSRSQEFKLRFCYKCWADSSKMYFNLEHQVKNNYICYKHNIRLQYILVNSNEYFLLDNSSINKYIDYPYCIAPNDSFLTCHSIISSIIHKIFIDGFEDDIVKLKSKIRMKMLSMDYMRSDFNFIENFNDFWSNFTVFNVLNIDKKDLINVIYSNSENPNPIVFDSLI
ncbi:MAG: TniQ family protein [Syntrophomonadaceae bacterium]|nr:TniQ family protein [Syntrophomonadaceae bacterium]